MLTKGQVNVVNLLNSSEGTLIGGFIEADIDGKFSSQYDLNSHSV